MRLIILPPPISLLATSGVEPYIVIGKDRHITVPDELKRIAVQADHDIMTINFVCPRFWDGHDLSYMQIYINYKRSDGYIGMHNCSMVRVDENDQTMMHFVWTVSRNVTLVAGKIKFNVCAKFLDENGHEKVHWNSEIYHDTYVAPGIEAYETVTNNYPDVITDLMLRIQALEEGGGGGGTSGGVDQSVIDALNNEIDSLTETVQSLEDSISSIDGSELVDLSYIDDYIVSLNARMDDLTLGNTTTNLFGSYVMRDGELGVDQNINDKPITSKTPTRIHTVPRIMTSTETLRITAIPYYQISVYFFDVDTGDYITWSGNYIKVPGNYVDFSINKTCYYSIAFYAKSGYSLQDLSLDNIPENLFSVERIIDNTAITNYNISLNNVRNSIDLVKVDVDDLEERVQTLENNSTTA